MTHNCYGRFCYKTGNCFHSHFHLLFAMASKCAFNFICLFVCLFWFVLRFAHSTYKIQTQIFREKLSCHAMGRWDLCWMFILWHRIFPHIYSGINFFLFPYIFIVSFDSKKKTILSKFNSKMENCIFFIGVIYVS